MTFEEWWSSNRWCDKEKGEFVWNAATRAALEASALQLQKSAESLLAPKRTNQVDRHIAFVLQSHADAIRARKP